MMVERRIDPKDVKAMQRIVKDLITFLSMRYPWFSSFVPCIKIIATYSIDTAGINRRGYLFINPDFFFGRFEKTGGLDLERFQFFVLMHEFSHIYLLHEIRGEGKNPFLWNIACDCVINEMLKQIFPGIQLPQGVVTAERISQMLAKNGIKISPERIRMMSEEAIYRLLMKVGEKKVREEFGVDLGPIGEDLPKNCGPSEGEGVPVQEGVDIPPGEEGVRRRVESAARSMAAGKIPSNVERVLKRIFTGGKINWRDVLKTALRAGIGTTVIYTWSKPSRRYPMRPGIKFLARPTLWALIDTSGSMDNDELSIIVAELATGALRFTKEIHVLPWDATLHGDILIKSPLDFTRLKTLPGGGGTVIYPALKYVKERVRPRDVVLIFSDFVISDGTSPQVIDTVKQIMSRAKVVCVTVVERPPFPCHTVIDLSS
ncbi:hypothetical protein DRP04_10350 [Archaeoglobales archaeon]|nr:MAG: hypothetical protein DRP04_10350 [Archaeoglobales archaeon]